MVFSKKKLTDHSESKIRRHFSLATMAGYPKLNGFICASHYFHIKFYSARRLTTIAFKRLLNLMCFLLFALIKIFYVYNNICSVA